MDECKPLGAGREGRQRAGGDGGADARARGAHGRGLHSSSFSSTCAVSDTKYTLDIPKTLWYLLNTRYRTPTCTPYPTESAYVKPKSGRV